MPRSSTIGRIVFLVTSSCFAILPAAARAQSAPVATLTYEIGAADLTAEHRAVLDDLLRRYPPADYLYWFEGDHDATGWRQFTPQASKRLSERLAETRWQNAAHYLGVQPLGLVHSTGRTDIRIFVERRSRALEDSIATLRREVDRLRGGPGGGRQGGGGQGSGTGSTPGTGATPPGGTMAGAGTRPDTIFAVAQLEMLYERSDKWIDRRWWESQGGFEVGILRVWPPRPDRRTGATLRVANGTPAHQPFEITTRLDLFRLGVERFGVTPALRWYDWSIRVHYGDDREARATFVNQSDPNYLIGLDLDARPWSGAYLTLDYAGVGSRVHAAHREVKSYDHYDLRFEQKVISRVRLELQAVYDERFEKSLAYGGVWGAYVWPMKLGEFAVSLGFVEQLDANLATAPLARQRAEDPISCISMGFAWRRAQR